MNIEKYTKLHNELMKKLEAGEITGETAKDVNDLAFEKYVSESVLAPLGIALGAYGLFVAGIVLLTHIREKIDTRNTVKLLGKECKIYKELLEKFAAAEKLINPSDTEISKLSVDRFKKLKNQDAIIKFIKADKDADTSYPDYPILNKDDEGFNSNDNIQNIINYATAMHGDVPETALFYKDEIICFTGNFCKSTKNSIEIFVDYNLPLAYPGLLYSYHTGIFGGTESIKYIMGYFIKEYPEEYQKACELNKTIKSNKGKK